MIYNVELTRDSQKFLQSCPQKLREHFMNQLTALEENPRECGLPLKGEFRGLYKMKLFYRGVQYRVIYEVDDQEVKVLVLIIDKRESIYQKAKKKRWAK